MDQLTFTVGVDGPTDLYTVGVDRQNYLYSGVDGLTDLYSWGLWTN